MLSRNRAQNVFMMTSLLFFLNIVTKLIDFCNSFFQKPKIRRISCRDSIKPVFADSPGAAHIAKLINKKCYHILITTCDKQDRVLFTFLCSGIVNEVLDMIEWTSNEFALQLEGVVGGWRDLIARSQL